MELRDVSIPQAVWIACNESRLTTMIIWLWFQYRKRYGLHAILSPRTLENSEPRNRFSSTEPSKRQVQRTQAIGQRLVCENVPRTRAKGEARLADVDRSALPFCTFPQTSGNFFVAKSGSKGVQSQQYQGNFCPRGKPKTHDIFSQISDFTVMKYSMKLKCCQYPLRNFFLCKRKGGNTHRERSHFLCRSYNVARSIFLYDGCSACGMPIISRACSTGICDCMTSRRRIATRSSRCPSLRPSLRPSRRPSRQPSLRSSIIFIANVI